MGTIGLSGGLTDDERIKALTLRQFSVWVRSLTLASRRDGACNLSRDDVESLATGATESDEHAETVDEIIGALVDQGLWRERQHEWVVEHNGLWTLHPDDAPDFYGGD